MHAVWLSVILPCLVNLIGLGSYAAVSAVFNVAAAVLDLSYAIPIAVKLTFGKFERGQWHIRRLGVVNNIYSVFWTAFITVLFFMPTVRPVTALNVSSMS